MEKKFYNEQMLLLKENFFYREKLYLISEIYFYTEKLFVLQIKYESFLSICSFCKKI